MKLGKVILALGTMLIAFVVAAQAASLQGQAYMFDYAGPTSSGPYTLGWQFQVTSPLLVTNLGYYDYLGDGLSVSHTVAIWDTAAPAVPLVTATVDAGTSEMLVQGDIYGPPPAHYINFYYDDDNPVPLVLVPGVTYRIGGTTNATETWTTVGATDPGTIGFVSSPQVTLGHGFYVGGAPLTYPTNDNGTSIYAGPNFLIGPVPEPSAVALLVCGGGVGLRRRRR